MLTEVVNQTNIIALHSNAGGDEDTPCNSLGIQPDTLHEGHIPLLVGGGAGMFDDIGVRLTGIRALNGACRVHRPDGLLRRRRRRRDGIIVVGGTHDIGYPRYGWILRRFR